MYAVSRSAPDYQPPLRPWGVFWRYTGCLLIGVMVWVDSFTDQWRDHRAWVWAALLVAVVAFGIVRYRRRYPLTVVLATNALSIFSALAAGPALLAIVSVATRRRYREIAVTAVISVASGVLYSEMPGGPEGALVVDLSFNVAITAAILGWGMYLGSRRELIWTLRRRAETAEAEQALRVSQARLNERRRIAREMHDVLAHRISQISLYAGALGFRDDLSAQEMRDSVGVIREKAHEALTDLRAVLGVLRDTDGELTPQPTYADLSTLVAEAAVEGMDVDLSDEIEATPEEPLPAAAGRTIYRFVQEGITNARKHAPGARLQVRLSGSKETGIEIELSNPIGFGSSTPGAGLGLVGLAERADLAGGRLEHTVRSGTFVLRGWIPWAT